MRIRPKGRVPSLSGFNPEKSGARDSCTVSGRALVAVRPAWRVARARDRGPPAGHQLSAEPGDGDRRAAARWCWSAGAGLQEASRPCAGATGPEDCSQEHGATGPNLPVIFKCAVQINPWTPGKQASKAAEPGSRVIPGKRKTGSGQHDVFLSPPRRLPATATGAAVTPLATAHRQEALPSQALDGNL